ncbi:LamG-like jellyroll fold domain-containing protein [Saltatorellus ferox]
MHASSAQFTLVSHYEMNETSGTICVDSSGNGNHGSYTGGYVLGQAGTSMTSGTAVDFDGLSGFVDIPGSPSLDALRSNLSIAAWIEADVEQLQRVFANRRPAGGGSGGSFAFGTTPAGLRFTTMDIQDYNQNVPVPCCQPHHLVVSFDASFLATFYLDGVLVGTVGGNAPANAPSGANQYLIAVLDLGGGTAEWFDGRIDDVQVYSGALGQNEVSFLHANPGSSLVGGALGANYCGPAPLNSTGASGRMLAAGSSITTNNNVTLTAHDLPRFSFGFFITSRMQGFAAGPGGSQGNLCLGGAIGRYVASGQIMNSGSNGAIDLGINLSQTPQPNGLVQVLPGETWNFQCWFRDSVGGAATSNFTDGLSIGFQ